MKIVVFGSTGKTGIDVIQFALEAGYEVIAYARRPEKIEIHNDKLSIVKGELSDKAAIDKAVHGVNAVISLLGASGNVKDNSLSNGLKNIIAAMEKNHVKRIIQVLPASAPDSYDKFDLYFDFMAGMVKTFMPKVYGEIRTINESLRNSSLDWTIVRVPFLKDDPLTKKLRIGYKGEKKVKKNLSRADLAWFIVHQIKSPEFIKKAPFISN